jgi:hypothetical protein
MESDDATPKAADGSVPQTVVIDLGKKSKKAIKRLKRGSIPSEVEQAIQQVRAALPDADKGKQIVPILLIYGRKRKRASLPLPFSPLNLLR